LVGTVGGERVARDQASLGYLIALAEEVQDDVGRLASVTAETEIASLGLDAQIELGDPQTRGRFLRDVQQLFAKLAAKYAPPEGSDESGAVYRVALVCYPAEGGRR